MAAMPARRVASRELKTRLGTYRRLVQSGIRIVVTDRGRPVAEMVPMRPAADDVEAQLDALAAKGQVARATCADLDEHEPEPACGDSVGKTLLDDREDRF